MRIVHTMLFFICVAVALVGYGAEAEREALEREVRALDRREAALKREIALLEAEWDFVSSAKRVKETLEKARAAVAKRGGEEAIFGAPLRPWRPDQLLVLDRPVAVASSSSSSRPSRSSSRAPSDDIAAGRIETADIPAPAEGGR